MESKELKDKLSVIKPYTFYGNDPPRRLSKEPSKILQPLMEWAEKTHYKRGGLAGHKFGLDVESPPTRPKNAYKFFFERTLGTLLAKGDKYRRDEVRAVSPTIKQMWMDAAPETISYFKAIAQEDIERFQNEMRNYENQHPELARDLRIKEHQRKAKLRRKREMKKVEKDSESFPSVESKTKRSSTNAAKKVSTWLAQLSEEDLQHAQPHEEMDHDGDECIMDGTTDTDDLSSSEESEDEGVGYTGPYRFPK